MSDRPRFVFDASVLVSAALFKGSTPDIAFRRALQVGELLASTATVAELSAVLARPKFDRYLTADERDLFLAKYVQRVALIEVTSKVNLCRDAKDDMYLELAQDGGAKYIVSGDSDLVDLHSFAGIPIFSPGELMALPRL
ncbi:MAG: putative toxin-antitoxin system toxin component, PIN family [Pirellulales bacterium]